MQYKLARAGVDPLYLQKIGQIALILALGLLIVNIIISVALIISITSKPHVKYIYHDSFGDPRELLVTDKPYFSDADVINWTVHKVTNLYSMDYVNYAKHLNEASIDFTNTAWNTWATSWKGPGNIEYIKEKHLIITATSKAASVAGKGVYEGVYTWSIKFPLYLKWENAGGEVTNLLNVTVKVIQTNDPLHINGLAIAELYAPQEKE